jgi:chromosome segregation ATPase
LDKKVKELKKEVSEFKEELSKLEKERGKLTKKVSDYQASEKQLLSEKAQLEQELDTEREAHLAGVDGAVHFHREIIKKEKEKREKLEIELSNLQNDYQQLKQEISQQKETTEELNQQNQLQEEKIIAYCEQIKK